MKKISTSNYNEDDREILKGFLSIIENKSNELSLFSFFMKWKKIFRRYKDNIILTNNNIDLKQFFEDKFSYIFYIIPMLSQY